MVELIKKKYNDSLSMGFIVIFLTILANFFLVKWALIDRHNAFQEKRFSKLLKATDHLFTALKYSEVNKASRTEKSNAFISHQLSLVREVLMSNELKALRIKLSTKDSSMKKVKFVLPKEK